MASTSPQQCPVLNSPDGHRLSEVERLLSSLEAEIPKVEALSGKWIQLTSRLEELPSYVRLLSAQPSSPAVTRLLYFIFKTLSDVLVLAHQCINPYPTNGKLKTKSDIDVALAEIDQFIDDVALLDGKGFLDIEDSSGSAKGSDVGVEATNLIKKLKARSLASTKISALDSLMELLSKDDWNVMIAMDLGLLPVLNHLLNSTYLDLKQKCLSMICDVIMPNVYVDGLDGDALIEPLHGILESRDGFRDEEACICLQEQACICLEALSQSKNMAIAMGSKRGLVASLLQICQSGTPSAQANAVSTLKNISFLHETSNEIFGNEDAMPTLIRLASKGSSLIARQHAIECLNNWVEPDDVILNRDQFVVKGGIECLKTYSDTRSRGYFGSKRLKKSATCRKIGDLNIGFKGFIAKLAGMLQYFKFKKSRVECDPAMN